MLRSRVLPYALALFAGSAVLAGCATSATAPVGPNASSQARSSNALLYVSDAYYATVAMYSYPALKLQGNLSGIKYPQGICVDPSTQDIWVVDAGTHKVIEFQHGATKPVREIEIDAYYPSLAACAVNPQNGDLAVTSAIFGSDPGAVLIFKNARGKPKFYNGILFFFDFVGYDANGDAFVDGYGSRVELAELAHGSKKLERVSLHDSRIAHPGGIQYDGSSMTLGNGRRVIYQIASGSLSGKTLLSKACRVGQFFIDGAQVIVPSRCGKQGSVLIYEYPAGGAPIARLGGLKNPFAVTISL